MAASTGKTARGEKGKWRRGKGRVLILEVPINISKQESKALRDKKRNRKALHVIGYDPSLEKVLSMLGVREGMEMKDVGEILPVEKRQRSASSFSVFPQATALVYALSAAILITSLRHNL